MKLPKKLAFAAVIASSSLISGHIHAEPQNQNKPQTESVKLVHASTITGYDVHDSNNNKIGDISNLVLDMSNGTRLSHVLITTGGFLGIGGETRVVPAEAISWKNQRYHLNASRETFQSLPLVGDDYQRFISRSSNLKEIAKALKVENKPIEGKIIFYDELSNFNVYSENDGRLGFFSDLLISVNDQRAPYLLMTPTHLILDTSTLIRYALPMEDVVEVDDVSVVFDVSVGDLQEADSPQQAENLSREESRRGLVYRLQSES